ncbi:MAG: TIGR01244 family sulfur transferase [Woeseiaceae bacterium]|nr:TIGR01244 family sulfur transferase [Woeseiaceae bacterium]
MKYRQLASDFAVASQIEVTDVPKIAAAGYRCVICNRPDHEDAGQPTVADIREACTANGIELQHVPIAGNALNHEAVLEQMNVMANVPGPYLAYCRSGTRSTIIWNVIQRMKKHV